MDGTHYGNAMTEIALALAMAFFSLMVLTLVSMGAGKVTPVKAAQAVTAALAPAAGATPAQAQDSPAPDDQLVIFDGGRFLDRDLKPFDPARVDPARRVILALDPDLPLADAMAARAKLATGNLVIAALDARWRQALERLEKGNAK